MAKWMLCKKKADFTAIGQRFGVDPVLARLLVNRGISEMEEIDAYLHPSITQLQDGSKMKDMAKAVSLLRDAIYEGKHIRVIGDYDIDGVQATYILHKGLQRLGAKVSYGIPHRVEDGYGLNLSMIEKCMQDEVGLVITCDNGISAREAIARAKEAGITVIVTDHHEVPFTLVNGEKKYTLPPADAIVNPKQENCAYPFKGLCGASVAWKVILQLYKEMEIPQEEGMLFIENAAFATIGDVMDLVGENRTIVSLGLEQLRKTTNLGMDTLMKRCELEKHKISSYHIGFVLGPCINASGRLDSATKALELLETEDVTEAAKLAAELVVLNEERKVLTEQGVKLAMEQAANVEDDVVLVLYLPEVHESVAGIIAGRVREQLERPVFVLVDGADGNGVKGSGRSMEGFSMFDEMCKCKELFTKFGGHPMAAGLSLPKENVEKFRQAMNSNTHVRKEDLEEVIHIDVDMPLGYINRKLIQELVLLEPFGKGNSKPIFAQKDVRFTKITPMGKNRQFLKMKAMGNDGVTVDAIYFGDGATFWEEYNKKEKLSICYYPQINTYQNRESIQIVITDFC